MSTEWNIGVVISIALFVVGALIALVVRMGVRFRGMENEITVLKTQVSPLWAAVQAKISKDLTHPSVQFKEMDALLVKLKELTITQVETERLRVLLDERAVSTDPEVSDSEKASALIMKDVMKKVVTERFNKKGV